MNKTITFDPAKYALVPVEIDSALMIVDPSEWRAAIDHFSSDQLQGVVEHSGEPEAWIRKTDITEFADTEPETNGWTELFTHPAPSQPSQERTSSFWVAEQFENGVGNGYWDGGSSRSFTKDIDKAVHFCRREDAFWTIRGWRASDVKITEHIMLPSTSQPSAEVLVQAALEAATKVVWGNAEITGQQAQSLMKDIRALSPQQIIESCKEKS